ncbi:MAG: formate dehydrogenase accessory sulfurtransferase FdhD [Eubacteriales bacterium]|nr:formate dehydrogenase accessory sulfurtransferase FdhD [Eubacteriales bacterium]
MKLKQEVEITRHYKDGTAERMKDEILIEYDFGIMLNDVLLVELLAIPKKLKELVVGYLYTERMITSVEDIDSLIIDEEACCARVRLKEAPASAEEGAKVTTDSGDYRMVPYQFYSEEDLKPLARIEYKPQTVLENFQKLMTGSDLFRNTGNVHSVLLCRGDEILYFAEDIGRFNAFDKAVGMALLDGVNLNECSLYTSGRIPSTIAMKALRAGIPMIVSRSAPSDRTLAVAEKYNLCIIGFTKRDQFNVYHEQR